VPSQQSSTGPELLVTLFEAGPVAGLSDGELLDRFVGSAGPGSESAVGALVARHSAMVWRVCRTAVGDDADAADAFQATFLILLRRARAIRQRESVAGWLGGVARRVAANARVNSARRRAREQVAAGRAGGMVQSPPDLAVGELAAVVRDELARLSDRDRAVVLACDLDGLTETEAARRLDCPVGTIRSRLYRARARLRYRFAARGLNPTAALGVLPTFEIAKIPATLVARTVVLAVRSGAGVGGWLPVCPVTVAHLVRQSGRSLIMLSLFSTGTVLVALVGLVPGMISGPGTTTGATASQDPAATKPTEPPAKPDAPPTPGGEAAPPAANDLEAATKKTAELADQYQKLVFEYDLARLQASSAGRAGKTKFEQYKIRHPLQPDDTAYARRMIALALLEPPSKVARDAAIWIMDKTWMSEIGEYETAVNILIAYHADDPEAVRVGLQLDKIINRRRDAFLEGCYANATSHESKGLARLAYAQYLEHKVPIVRGAHNFPKRSVIHFETYDAAGKLVPATIPEGNQSFAYDVGLRWVDPIAMQTEVERLYNEVITEYADVRYIDRQLRRIEAELAHPIRPDGSSMNAVERIMAQEMVNSKTTLADVARRRLSKLTTLTAGKPAPEVAGVDLITNQPFKLADYRGKTVLLFFWADIDDREFVHKLKERESQERGKGRPFAVIGVVYAKDQEAARRLVEREQVSWLNTAEGNLTAWGEIGKAYQIPNIPRGVLIDSEGKIADPEVRKIDLDDALDRILNPAKTTKLPG